MSFVLNLILIAQILAAAVMVGLVLMQHGKGADMGASFGSGASGSLFGATGSANFLSRSTAVAASVFFVCTLALAYVGTASLGAGAGAGVMGQLAAAPKTASRPQASSMPAAIAQIPAVAGSAAKH